MNIKQYLLVFLAFLLTLACAPSQLFIPTATPTPTIALTSTPLPVFTPTPTPAPTFSAIDKIVDEYLTAIEHDNWQVAYDYLCSEIQSQIKTPDEMYKRILLEVGSIPNEHTILPPPDRPYRVLFVLSRTEAGSQWASGEREAKLEEGSLKICGVGATHGDLRYLLQIGNTDPLNIIPFESEVTPLNPEDANTYFQRATSVYQSAVPKGSLETYISQLDQALANIDKAISLNPGDGDFYSLRQSIYFSLAGTVEYDVDRQYLVAIALDNAYKAYELGTTAQYPERIIIVDLIGTNQCQKALNETQKLIDQSPAGDISVGGLLHIRSQAYACLGRLDDALQSVNDSMFNNVNMEYKNDLKVQYLLMLGRYDEALPILDERIQESNLTGWLHYMRAEAYYNLGKKNLVQKELNDGMVRTWGRGGWLAYVEAQIALNENRIEDAIRLFQFSEATLDQTYNPLRWKIQEQLELLNAQPLILSPSVHYQSTPIPKSE